MDSEDFIVDSLSYDIEINFPTLEKSEKEILNELIQLLDIWKPSVKSSPGNENDLFEPIKLKR